MACDTLVILQTILVSGSDSLSFFLKFFFPFFALFFFSSGGENQAEDITPGKYELNEVKAGESKAGKEYRTRIYSGNIVPDD